MAVRPLMTLSEFRAVFSEFERLEDATVQEYLDEAEEGTPAAIWGNKRRDGHKWLAAHLCSQNPRARDLRNDKDKSGMTIYLARRKTLESIVASGWRVTGL